MHLTGDLIKRRHLAPAPSNDSPYVWRMAIHRRTPFDDLEMMSAAEQMFFLGAPLAHVVQYEERERTLRAELQAPRLARLR